MTTSLVGVRHASTFTGFCGKHDSTTFAPLETIPFTYSPEQCFLLGYRALCRELYAKQSHVNVNEQIKDLDRGRHVLDQMMIQSFASLAGEAASVGLQDMQDSKKRYDAVLLSGNYSDVRFYGIELNCCPEFMCSGFFSPDEDFAGNALQDFERTDKRLDQLGFSLIATDKGGAVTFVWHKDHDKTSQRFMASFDTLSESEKISAIVAFTFARFENVCMSPVWWENLQDDARKKIAALRVNNV